MTDVSQLERAITSARLTGDTERLHDLQTAYRASATIWRSYGLPIEFRATATRASRGQSSAARPSAKATAAAQSTQTDDIPRIVERPPWKLGGLPMVSIAAEVKARFEQFEDDNEVTAWVLGDVSGGNVYLVDLQGLYRSTSPYTAIARGREQAQELAERRGCFLLALVHSHPGERRDVILPSPADLRCWSANTDANPAGVFIGGILTPSNNPHDTRGTEWCSPRSRWWLASAKQPNYIFEIHPGFESAA